MQREPRVVCDEQHCRVTTFAHCGTARRAPEALRLHLRLRDYTCDYICDYTGDYTGDSKVTFTESADFWAGPWNTASMLLPSGSRTKAA